MIRKEEETVFFQEVKDVFYQWFAVDRDQRLRDFVSYRPQSRPLPAAEDKGCFEFPEVEILRKDELDSVRTVANG